MVKATLKAYPGENARVIDVIGQFDRGIEALRQWLLTEHRTAMSHGGLDKRSMSFCGRGYHGGVDGIECFHRVSNCLSTNSLSHRLCLIGVHVGDDELADGFHASKDRDMKLTHASRADNGNSHAISIKRAERRQT